MHPTIIKAAVSADATRKRIERVAGLLAKLMQDLHGDEWKADVSHSYNEELILIIPRPGRSRQRLNQPSPEVM